MPVFLKPDDPTVIGLRLFYQYPRSIDAALCRRRACVIAFGMAKNRRRQSQTNVGERRRKPKRETAERHNPSEPSAIDPRYGGGLPWFICSGLIVLTTVLVYLNSFDGVFVLDDNRQIIENPRVHRLTPVSGWLDGRRPVISFTFAMNYHFGRLNPWGYHLVNLVVHVLAALTLFGVVRRTLLLPRFEDVYVKSANGFAVAVALLWAVHPLQTSSVTYVVQRGESMMGMFYLLTLHGLIRGATSEKAAHGWSVLTVICCGLGMGTKAVMVTAPFILLVYDRVFISESFASAFRKRWGLYIGLAATWLVLAAVGVGNIFATSSGAQTTVGFSYKGIRPWNYLLTQAGVILHYLGLCFWPAGQCLDYVWRPAQGLDEVWGVGLVILVMLTGTILAVFLKPRLAFLGLWFFVILAPTSSFIPVKDPAFEHRMYLPLAAVVVMVVFGGHLCIAFVCKYLLKHGERARWISAVSVSVLVLGLGHASVKRNRVFHSLRAMWWDVITAQPQNPRAHFGYGRALRRENRIEDAIWHYKEAIRISPTYAKVYTNLGNALASQGRYEEAVVQHRQAIELKPNLAQAHMNLAGVYVKMNEIDRGIAAYREVLRIRPDWAVALARLGRILAVQGQNDEAIVMCRKAIDLDSKSVEAHYGLAFALWRSGRTDESIQGLQTVLKLDPQHPRAGQLLQKLKLKKSGRRD
ncbi:MAG: tetratricopeptide repeat protein [Phycisphaerales bacterium]|nr:tetratricopeptide repeat protein [Phycisphaerales bacterium]